MAPRPQPAQHEHGWTPTSRRLLLSVLLLALAHALVEARLRPLYQVSDEMAYLGSAQDLALVAWPQVAACIAPPDGIRLDTGLGGKVMFRRVVGWQLGQLCRLGADQLPLFWLRALQALSFPLVAFCAALLARQLSGRTDAAVLAALVVASHPVAAKYAGGVTPDAWANGFASLAFVAATQLVSARWHWHTPWLLGGVAFAGLLWKDTATMLAPLAAMAVALAIHRGVFRRTQDTPVRRRTVSTSLAGLIAASVLFASAFTDDLRSAYMGLIPEAHLTAVSSPFDLVSEVVDDVRVNLVGILTSSVVSLYRPLVYASPVHDPGSPPSTPPVALAVVLALFGVGGCGAVAWLVSGMHRGPACRVDVLGMWTVGILLCLAQPSVRQVLLGGVDSHQGRWLFPVLAPVAALAGVGLSYLGRRRPCVPGIVLAVIAGVWVVVFDLVRHFYAELPGRLNESALFLRPTGDHDIGDLQVLDLIATTSAAQDPTTTWGILLLLGVASLWVIVSAFRHSSSAPHV